MEESKVKRACGCCLSIINLIDVTNEPINPITFCFSIHISNYYASKKSSFICYVCNEKLKDCAKFRQQIIDTQNKLKNLSTSVNSNDDLKDDPIKIEISNHEESSDVDVVEEVKSLVLENCSNGENDQTNIKYEAEDIKIDIKQEVKSNSKKKESHKRKKLTIRKGRNILSCAVKKREQCVKSLPFKLDKEALACEICDKKFTGHRLLVSHMAIHYPNFICDMCGKSFLLKVHLRKHVITHKEENVTCTICEKVLKVSSLRVHMKNHYGDNNRFVCPYCAERFPSLDHRLKHMGKFHNVDIYKHQCNFCCKKFHVSGILSKHIRQSHYKESNVYCSVCDKGFFTAYELSRHMIKHTGEKNYQCDVCSKSYAKKFSLTLHMKTHTGNVEKHKCSYCDKEFTQKGSCKVHIKNVHGK